MSGPDKDDSDVDASYRDAFSGLFGDESESEAPKAPPEPREQSAAERTSQVADASSSGPIEFQETADASPLDPVAPDAEPLPEPVEEGEEDLTASSADAAALDGGDAPDDPIAPEHPPVPDFDSGSITTAMSPSGSWLDIPAPDEEETGALSRERTHTFLDDAGGRNSRASFPIDPSLVDTDLPMLPPAMFVPGEGTAGAEQSDLQQEIKLVESDVAPAEVTEETTRAMENSEVDNVLRDMEQRVRDLHAASPHDTAEDLVYNKPVALDTTVPDLRPAESAGERNPSTAKLLETWIRKNATGGVHFEPVGTIEPPRACIRTGAALEIGRTHLRYLELQPYQSGRQVATRFEQVALAEASGSDRLPRVIAALATLRERLGGKMQPCTVLHSQGGVGTRVLTLPVGTRAIDGAVRGAVTSETPLVHSKRVMGKIRVGNDSIKSVLVSYASRDEVGHIQEGLAVTGTPVLRISSSQVAFLETVVTHAARIDEDAAEAFVFIERTTVTVALAARGVLLLARVIKLEKEAGTPDWEGEILDRLKEESSDLERACGGGELARIRYAIALPPEIDFPNREIVVAFGRPAEVIDIELLFRIDLDSVKQLGVPADAIVALAPAAYEATLDDGGTLDLGRQASPAAVAAAWALVVALLVLVVGAAASWEPASSLRQQLRDEVDQLDRSILRDEHVQADHAAVLEVRAQRDASLAEKAALDGVAARPPEAAALLRELAPARPQGVFYERFHVVRADLRPAWELELTAIGVGDRDKGAALVGELVLRLRQGSLGDLTTRATSGQLPDESQVTIGAKAGGVK